MAARSRVVLIGTEGRRAEQFSDALRSSGFGNPVFVHYRDIIRKSLRLSSIVEPGDVVRIESPGKDFELEKELLRAGGAEAVDSLLFDRGLILPQRAWYRGWCDVLNEISQQLSECAPHMVMNSADEIALMFDKVRCQDLLYAAQIPVPHSLGTIACFDELRDRMRAQNCRRVFLKPAHSSSASGIIAYEFSGDRHRAATTVETVEADGQVRLYNSRKVRKLSDLDDIRVLVDRLAEHNLFVQRWYPKAGIGGKTFDLRVVVIGGKAKNVVVRQSRTPFTNLHLLNMRGQLSLVRAAMGEERYAEVLSTCERAARLFPNCLYVGVDVLISSDFRGHAIAELNAFGDQLPGVLHEGKSTYEWELEALAARRVRRATTVVSDCV